MGSEKLEADPVTVYTRFSDEVQLACPLFQRRYVWGRKNIDQLWADIDTVLDGQYSKRFLGALVFNNEAAPTASKAGRYWIIDGQQRLTTLYLMLVAMAQVASEHGDEGLEFGRETFRTYLVSSRTKTLHQPKFRPTLIDGKQFQTILFRAAEACDARADVNPNLVVGDSDGQMTSAFSMCVRHVKSRLVSETDRDAGPLERLQNLRNTVLESLELVEIRLGSEHDPNEVFDRLNKEGERLGILDLVRNEVLKHLDHDPHVAQAMFSREWKPFEDAFADEPAKAKYFFPFALTVKDSATQASTFKVLTENWAASTKELGEDNAARVQRMVRDLRRYQSAFNAIHSRRLTGVDEPIRERVRRLVSMNRPSVIYPYVMQAVTAASEGDASPNQVAEALGVVESFLVRRAFCGLEPTGLHAVFKKLWGAAGADPGAVRENLTTKTISFPSDGLFGEAVKDSNLYERRICRYVLEEYERGTAAGDILEIYPPITVDHVAPRSLKGEWADVFKGYEHVIHTWANLVPLSNEANSTKGAMTWERARQALEHETVFSTTRRLYALHSQWGPEEVKARSEDLREWALLRWPE